LTSTPYQEEEVITTKVTGTPQTGLTGATLGFFVGFAGVSLFGPTVVYLKQVVGLSAALAGLLISIPNLSGSLLRVPFAAMVDKDGGRIPFLILFVTSLLGVLVIWFVMSQPVEEIRELFPLLLLFGVLGGTGIATFSVGIGQTSYWFPQKKQGTALGVYAGVGNMAPGLFALLLTSVTIPLFGLPTSYLLWAGFLVVGIILYWFLGRNAWYFQFRKEGLADEQARSEAKAQGQELFPRGNTLESLRVSAKLKETWLLVLVYFATFGGFLALTAWMPALATGYLGYPLWAGGVLTAAYSMGASVFRIAGGALSDRLGGMKTVVLSLITALVGSLLIALSLGGVFTLVGISLLALGMGIANAGVFKLVPQFISQAVGGAAGWIGGLGAVGGFLIPLGLAGILGARGQQGYAEGFWIFVALFAISLGIMAMLARQLHGGKK